jgi:hypothetical protein
MDSSRRKLLKAALLGAGGLGLRGLASALPAGILAAPFRAGAADACDAAALPAVAGLGTPDRPQRLILITSAAGDPLNANVPGSYTHPLVYHPVNMPTKTVTLGGTEYQCGGPWADLFTAVPALAERTCFFHHATYSNAHGDHAKVNAFMGAIRRQELLVSLLANHIHTCAPATTQAAPVVLSNVLIRYQGAVLPVLNTGGLARVLAKPGGQALALRDRRDADLGQLNALFRESGTPAQQAAVDAYSASQDQARAMDPSLVGSISGTTADGNSSQRRLNSAAVSILAMNMSPVVVMSYDWGGDNHSDGQLNRENDAHIQSCAALGDLHAKLAYRNLQDDVTVIAMNVFGRTLNAANRGGNTNGRDHNAAHHCTVIMGRGFKGCVVGGVTLTPSGNEFRCQDIDSATGQPAPGGDIPYVETLASLAKTIAAGVGVSRNVIDGANGAGQITMGKYVEAALR